MLLRRHAGALRADFRRWYGLDLRELWWGGLSVLEAADLAAHLPPGSATWREYGGELAWTDEVTILAAVEFGVRVLAWQKSKAGAAGRDKPAPISPPELASARKAADSKQLQRARRSAARQRRAAQAPKD